MQTSKNEKEKKREKGNKSEARRHMVRCNRLYTTYRKSKIDTEIQK